MALASGAMFAGYSIARRLGSGTTGDVYLVQDPHSSRWQALKVLTPTLSDADEFRRRFAAQTPVAVGLHHPNIVEVRERGEFEGRLYVVMEYVEGISAARLMAERFPAVSPAGEALAIVTAIAAALDHAHHRGLLHGDVKPGNVVLTGRGEGGGRILLADFGIAPPLGEPGNDAGVGTLGYAAPEQLMGAPVDGRADQYALAATAFHLLTGAPPVEFSDPLSAARHARNPGPPRLSDQRPELASLDDVFARALATKPADRFRTCRRFAQAATERAGAFAAEPSSDAVVAEYPTHAWPGRDDAANKPKAGSTTPARVPARRLGDSSAARAAKPRETSVVPPVRRRPRKFVVAAAVTLLVLVLLAVGYALGRRPDTAPIRTAGPSPTPGAAVAPAPVTAPPAAPVPLDGTYRLEVQRSQQTFNYTSDPQPPDVGTWWAFRSSCTPGACTAVGILLDDRDHTQAKSSEFEPLVLDFRDGRWLSRPQSLMYPCIGPNGAEAMHSTTQVLSLRPQQGELRGEMTVTVHSNECGQLGAVLRAPAVVTRTGELPPNVAVPDPAAVADTGAPTTAPSPPPR